MNAHGEHKIEKEWPNELILVAKHGWTLSKMSPSDMVTFDGAAEGMVGTRTTLNSRDLLHLYIAAFIKLPHAVEAWRPSMRIPGPPVMPEGGPRRSGPDTADEFATAAFELAVAINGVQAVWEHEQLSTGRQNIILGPQTFFRMFRMSRNMSGTNAQHNDSTEKMHTICIGKKRGTE